MTSVAKIELKSLYVSAKALDNIHLKQKTKAYSY